MGTDDYIRPIHPEDDMEIMGDYVMYRFYPDYTETRLEMGLPHPIPPERLAAFEQRLFRRISEVDPSLLESSASKEKKGRAVTVGLWMFATDAREPLKDVMMRYVVC